MRSSKSLIFGIISGLVIEPSESDEPSGFDVSVDGWETVVVNYTD